MFQTKEELESIYEKGLDLLVVGDVESAVNHLKMAVSKNHILSQLELGKLIIADPKLGSPKEAAGYFRSAAEAGDPEAQSLLGRMYLDGEGVEQSDKKAFKWISLAAEQNEPYALDYLGYMYYEGRGTEKSFEKALDCFVRSADEGNPEGAFNAGSMYLQSEGTNRDLSKAEEYFLIAADSGDPMALTELAKIYLETDSARIPEIDRRFRELLEEDERLQEDYEEFKKVISSLQ
jgi:SEL1 protein